MATQTIHGNLHVTGNVSFAGTMAGGSASRTILETESGIKYHISVDQWRVWDAMQTNLGTGSADDLGIRTGTFGTNIAYLSSGDLNAAGAITRYARALVQLPTELVTGQNFYLRVVGIMLTAVASVSATVDAEVYLHNGVGGVVGGDLCLTSATDINQLTSTTVDFELNSSSVVAGDVLDIRLTIAANSATASSHFAVLPQVLLLLPVRG